jgi:hypothetical protein
MLEGVGTPVGAEAAVQAQTGLEVEERPAVRVVAYG